MTTLAVAAVVGVVLGALGWVLAHAILDHPTLARRNVRGLDVPTAGGVLILVGQIPVWAALNVHASRDWTVVSDELLHMLWPLPFVLVFGLLGLIDDLLATGGERGFAGHLGALVRGRLTTGGLKLVGGGLAAVALAAAAGAGRTSWWMLVVDAALIALAANLANLFDRAPGRVTKVSIAALVVLVATGGSSELAVLAGPVFVVGLAVGLLVPELRERLMLGDTGANPLGAVLGAAVVLSAGTTTRLVVAVAMLALNLASERTSFSAVIDRTPVLRWIDRLGRASD